MTHHTAQSAPIPQPTSWHYGPPGAISQEIVGGVVDVLLQWSRPTTTIPVFNDPAPPAAESYVVWVYRVEAVAANLVLHTNVTGTQVTAANLDVGTTYIVHVSANAPAPEVGPGVFSSFTFVA